MKVTFTVEQLCTALVNHARSKNAEMFEKFYAVADSQGDCEVHSVVIVVNGPRAEEFLALAREWAHRSEMKRHD